MANSQTGWSWIWAQRAYWVVDMRRLSIRMSTTNIQMYKIWYMVESKIESICSRLIIRRKRNSIAAPASALQESARAVRS